MPSGRSTDLLLLLAALCLCPPAARAYPPGSGSAVAGDLDAIPGPYGIPSDKFRSATTSSAADASAAFDVTGYNVSAAATGNSPVAVAGWRLAARVQYDVSLSDATTTTDDDDDKKTEATTLYLEAPEGMTMMGASWRICAVVWPGLASAVANSTPVDGTCNGVLGAECVQALTASAGSSSGATGMDNAGDCTSFELPSRCADAFPDGSGNNSAITINQTVLENKRFYAYASAPTSPGNSTAEAEAKENVWPVLTIFGHVSSGGQLSSANTAVQCVRAINGTAEDDVGSSAPPSRMGGGGGKTTLLAAVVGTAFVVTGWVCMF